MKKFVRFKDAFSWRETMVKDKVQLLEDATESLIHLALRPRRFRVHVIGLAAVHSATFRSRRCLACLPFKKIAHCL
jgi:hypothetical protein